MEEQQDPGGSPPPTLTRAEGMERYRLLLDLVHQERRLLQRTDNWFLLVNLGLLALVVLIILSFPAQLEIIRTRGETIVIVRTLVLLALTVGMGLSTYWVTHSLRLQLRLKLRYFQTRTVERALDGVGTNILSDEATFFSKRELRSADGQEKVLYPSSLDGFMGSMKQRIWSWFLPLIFFLSYFYAFVYLLLGL